MKGVGGDRRGFKKGGKLVEVDFNEAAEGVSTGCEGIVRDDVAGGGLHDGCFEVEKALFAEICSKR